MTNKKPRIGKYILDTLSIGMYNHPLMLIREYIQNSTDSIDELAKTGAFNTEDSKIEIIIDGRTKTIVICDSGFGVPTEKAWNALHDIGKSEKKYSGNRGFRGIGRLGGIGYCEDLQFITKAKGESIYTINTWRCEELRQSIKEDDETDTSRLIKKVTDFKQQKYEKNNDDHFFIVKMLNIQSSRDILLNVPVIKSYLSEVSPVPFNVNIFSYAELIEEELMKRVPKYKTYKICVNGEQIFKPYSDVITLRGDKKDKIRSIDYFKLNNLYTEFAFGWIAQNNLSGSISSSCLMDGIRVRCGNIQIGDKNLLNDFFRERRFNNYLSGELHVIDHRLIPNSRRDDFEDNEIREEFYDSFIRNIGLPFSRKIRQSSLERSQNRMKSLECDLLERSNYMIRNGYFSEHQRDNIIKELLLLRNNKNNGNENEYFDNLISKICESRHFLERWDKRVTEQTKKYLRSIFDIIFKECRDKEKAEKIIRKIVGEANYPCQ